MPFQFGPFILLNLSENEYFKQTFQPAGGENPESFYTAFSWDLLEAAFKVIKKSLPNCLNSVFGYIYVCVLIFPCFPTYFLAC